MPAAMRAPLSSLAIAWSLAAALPAHAEDRAVPYWAALRARQVNMRVGPSESYRISWVYRRQQLPIKVLRLKEGWRLVEDPDGARGWMLAQFLSPDRTALVVGEGLAEMRGGEGGSGALLWHMQPGVVGRLGACAAGWCRFDVGGGHVGYAPSARLWGSGAP